MAIDDIAYWIPPQGYTWNNKNTCIVAINSGANNGFIELGSYFLDSYYAQFNYTDMQVSLGVNSKAAWTASIGKAGNLVPTTNFTVKLNNTLNTWQGPLYIGTPE